MCNEYYYSKVAEEYRNRKNNNYYNSFNACSNDEYRSNKHDECNDNHRKDRERCCGRRFNNRKNDEKVQRALRAFENQLKNTDAAIDCLNKLFNNLEDDLYEDRCCLSNRIKNIIQSIQTDICDLDDDLRGIRDDFECLEQAL